MSSDRRDDLPQDSEGEDEPRKRGRTAIKWVIAAIPILAALFGIAAGLEGLLNGSASAKPGSTPAEYAAVCSLANTRQREWEQDLAGFRHGFVRAKTLTAARNALLRLTEQDIDSTAELRNHVDALTPPHRESDVQRNLERDWNRNLGALETYREQLGVGVGSAHELEDIVRSLPRSKMETRANDARGKLLKLGSSSCNLEPVRSQPVAQWPRLPAVSGPGEVQPDPAPARGPEVSVLASQPVEQPTPPDVEPPKGPSSIGDQPSKGAPPDAITEERALGE